MARSKLLAAIVFVVPALAACNAIIGLSDFHKGDCAGGGACLDEAGPVTTPEAGGVDSGGSDSGVDGGGRGAVAVSWARWPIPNYPNAEGGVPASLTPRNDGTVLDNKTNLIWQQVPDGTPLTFDAAVAACTALAAGPWRLPKRIELVTLLDYSHVKPFIDIGSFTNFSTTAVAWTSSEYRTVDDNNRVSITTQNWTIDFGNGTVTPSELSTRGPIAFCVKDAQ